MAQAVEAQQGVAILVDALRAERLDPLLGVAGRPLTPVIEALVASGHARWVAHEATALQLALGAAACGKRTAVLVKQVGVNALLDVLACAAPHRTGGAAVVIAGDDPGGAYSQLEGDSRLLAASAEVPCIDAAGAADLPAALAQALTLSAEVRTPAVLRVTTQTMLGELQSSGGGERATTVAPAGFAPSRTWRTDPLGQRRALLADLRALPDGDASLERPGNGPVRVVASGEPGARALAESDVELLLVRRVFPPPRALIATFAVRDERPLLVLEDGRPLLEDEVRACGAAAVLGRRSGHVPWAGPVDALAALAAAEQNERLVEPGATLVTGDPRADLSDYGTLFDDAVALGLTPMATDAGNSWAAAYLPGDPAPLAYGLGSAIGVAGGVALATGKPAVAVIGDYGIYHAGVLALLQIVRDRLPVIVVIADNGLAAYTGGQPHPGSDPAEGQSIVPLEQLLAGTGLASVTTISREQATSPVLRSLLERLTAAREPAALVIRSRA